MGSTAGLSDMADKILHKRADTPGKVPLPADLIVGELAINTADGALFTKLADGTVVAVTLQVGGGSAITLAQAQATALLF